MARIDMGRVVLGGLLAGLVINISESVLNLFVLGAQTEEIAANLGLEPVGSGGIGIYVLFGFIIGTATVWLYAAIRPRFGPGPGTALTTGAAVWVLAHLFRLIDFTVFARIPAGFVTVALVWTLVETMVAALAGGWLYREAEGSVTGA